MKNTKYFGYMCGADFQYGVLDGVEFPQLYNTIEELKLDRQCWPQCGVVKVELSFVKWEEPQNFDLIGEEDETSQTVKKDRKQSNKKRSSKRSNRSS